MVAFVPLASGSQGNSILVRGRDGAFLIDAGLPREEMFGRLRAARQEPGDLDGVLLTHRHRDHVRSAGAIARRFKVPIYATRRTLEHQRRRMLSTAVQIHPGLPFRLAGYRVCPIRLCHDAPETVGFLLETAGVRIGVATDLGSSGGGLAQAFTRLDVLYLEFNHDLGMLRAGPYTWPLKHRIASARGHLSNHQAATLVRRLATPRLRCLYLAHLSEVNNTPALAMLAAAEALDGAAVEIRIAQQNTLSRPFKN